MLPSSYKNLIAYQKAKILTIGVITYFSSQTKNRISEILINQLVRSVSSIGANIAEGYGRYYQKSYRQFLGIARGSCFETDYWFEVMIGTNIFDQKKINEFKSINEEIIKILTTLMKNADKSET